MIAAPRLVLRPPAASDLPFILTALNTSGVLRHLGGTVRSEAEVKDALDADIAAFASGAWRHWIVFRRDDDEPVGRVGLFRVLTPAAPEALRGQTQIGWTVAEAWQRRGYALEAAQAALAHGFGPLDTPVIYAQTSDSNAASTGMMARLGFRAVPELQYVDPGYPAADNPTTVYRLTREQWSGQG